MKVKKKKKKTKNKKTIWPSWWARWWWEEACLRVERLAAWRRAKPKVTVVSMRWARDLVWRDQWRDRRLRGKGRKEIGGDVGVSFGWGCGNGGVEVDIDVSFEGKGGFVRRRVTGRQRVGSWCLGLWEKGRKKWEVGNGKIVCVWEGSDQKWSGKWNIFVETGLGELETPLATKLNFVTKELKFC